MIRRDVVVAAELRTQLGKNASRRTRRQGKLPAVLYGAGKNPVPLAVDPKDIHRIVHLDTGVNTVFWLRVQDKEETLAMIADWQLHPVRDELLHVDFKRIDPNKPTAATVPIVVVGDAYGVKNQGGVLEIVTREIEIECLPAEIPDRFEVDVSELKIGDSIRAGDLPLSGSMRLLEPPETVLVHVVAPRVEAEAAEGEEVVTPAEPEVTGRGKREQEE